MTKLQIEGMATISKNKDGNKTQESKNRGKCLTNDNTFRLT